MTRIEPYRVIPERSYEAAMWWAFAAGVCFGVGCAAVLYWRCWR